jgi:large subunit ribosomal protein L31e
MENKKSSSKMGRLPSGKGSNSENSEKLSSAGDLAKGKKEVKKLDDVKDSPENKAAIVADEGGNLTADGADGRGPKDKVESKPAVAKFDKKKDKKNKGEVVELEREYVVPLKKGVLKAPKYRRAKKAVKVLKEFMVRHMNVRDRDLRKVKIDRYLNNELWFRGIKKPANKIKVKAKKIDGIVYVELAEVPEVVKFAMAREKKAAEAASAVKAKAPKKKEEEKTEEEKVEEKEDAKAGAEKAAKVAKVEAKAVKHTAQGKHAKKTMPVRKVLK